MRGHINSPVFPGCGQAEHVIIFVDGSSDSAETVMTVSQNVGNGKFLQAGSSGSLNNPHIGNIVGSHLVKFDFELLHIVRAVVVTKNAVGNGLLSCLLTIDFSAAGCCENRIRLRSVGNDLTAVQKINACLK